ncbi:cell division cycle-associated protein 3 isoform X1 [Poecilia reticulata]|uniref:cell division cycle-associated protein 3 isoform X1 n=1 Tax=Poecilia reticulata TaxID=8081 RepID=UPI0004A49BDF|nr:PREDICTED: cell division cycle-associated protein 3 isoform X1 [Poecilia reticulata]XP_008429616.1 PREDICTED: cell division cycle-associated protein 3 isoform X1 [Poecilia reticulata]XP_008429617.1 PREDICTED: cell division cycle-associated protein 3 isoform X1 [Poecilia reticulata]
MGTSESKMAVSADAKPQPAIKKTHVSHLIDPRSPSAGIDRTPIQVCGKESTSAAAVKSECPLAVNDPRSPTFGITRTPVREIMRATVGSFTRRLGMLFHNEAEGKVPEGPQKRHSDPVDEVHEDEELASTEPLLSPRRATDFGSVAEHANFLAAPDQASQVFVGNSSPFELLWDPQVAMEIETEANISLEEAEEARETPLHKRLSMSLMTCHEGATSSQVFEIHHESRAFSEPNVEKDQVVDGVDHAYARPSVTVQPKQTEETKSSLPPSEQPDTPSPEQVSMCTGIRCPTFDMKSPSQLEFKPQWLGKGFGATGLRSRGVQGNKGSSSPLAVRVAVKSIGNENKGQSGKLKQKGTEGRSPLQILKETNSPRDQRSQMKLKVSNQSKQRLGQMDRRVLAVSLDKENH